MRDHKKLPEIGYFQAGYLFAYLCGIADKYPKEIPKEAVIGLGVTDLDKSLLLLKKQGLIKVRKQKITIVEAEKIELDKEEKPEKVTFKLYANETLTRIQRAYKTYCKFAHRTDTKVRELVAEITIKKLTPEDLALFFRCVKCMVYEENTVSLSVSFKEKATAKKILLKGNDFDILDLVITFINDFEKYETKNVTEPSIFNMEFLYQSIKTKNKKNTDIIVEREEAEYV